MSGSPFDTLEKDPIMPSKMGQDKSSPKWNKVPPLGEFEAKRNVRLSNANIKKGDKFHVVITPEDGLHCKFDDDRKSIKLTHGSVIWDHLDKGWIQHLKDPIGTALSSAMQASAMVSPYPIKRDFKTYAEDLEALLGMPLLVETNPHKWVVGCKSVKDYMRRIKSTFDTAGFVRTKSNKFEHAILGSVQIDRCANNIYFSWLPNEQ